MENLKERYDVIVVGAGPAGGSCARELAKKGHKVLIIDRAAEIGEPNYSTAGTHPETIKEFSLPKEVILKSWKNLQFRGPNEKFVDINYNKIIGYTLDFRSLKQFLVKDAITNEATTHIQTTATDLIKDSSGKIIGVKTEGIEGKKDYFADVIVDATGVEGKFANALGLRKIDNLLITIGFEQFITNINLPNQGDTVYIGLGSKEAPAGYTWVFPTGRKEAKVGIAWMPAKHKEKKDIKTYFYKFVQNYPGFDKAEEIENHAHSAVMGKNGRMLDRYSLDGFLCIGCAAAQINPLAGEGIRHFLRSGRMAAQVISNAIKNTDFSQKKLNEYDKIWKEYAQDKWKICNYLHKFIYDAPDDLIDAVLETFGQLNREDLLNIFWKYDKQAIERFIFKLAEVKTHDFKEEFLGLFK